MNVNIGDVFVDFSTPIIARVKKYIDNKITFQMILELCETKKVENKQEEEKKEEKDDKKKYFWNIKEITIKNKDLLTVNYDSWSLEIKEENRKFINITNKNWNEALNLVKNHKIDTFYDALDEIDWCKGVNQ